MARKREEGEDEIDPAIADAEARQTEAWTAVLRDPEFLKTIKAISDDWRGHSSRGLSVSTTGLILFTALMVGSLTWLIATDKLKAPEAITVYVAIVGVVGAFYKR